MTKQEASERYNIPIWLLDEYESWGLCREVKKVMGSWQYDDSDLERLSMIMTLHDVGFTGSEIEAYMRLLQEGYPTPLVVVGTMVNGKPNWTLVGHLGIIGHDRVMVSMSDSHYSNQGIRAAKALSINIVDEAMLKEADYAGCVSGAKEDKSKLFAHHIADGGVPIIDAAPVSMACTVEDVYKTEGFESFICKIAATYAEETVLDDSGRLDYSVLKPVLFEMPTYQYLKTGEVLGKCMSMGGKEA